MTLHRVLIDTNYWISTNLFRGALGIAATHMIRSSGWTLLLPEIVEREVEENSLATLRELFADHAKTTSDIEALLGIQIDQRPVSSLGLEDAIRLRFTELDEILARSPFTFDDAKAALDKCIRKVSPCSRSQQFKDAAIWNAVLRSAETAPTTLVSHDKAFFNEATKLATLAPNLAEEAKSCAFPVKAYFEIADFLAGFQAKPIDDPGNRIRDEVVDSAIASLMSSIDPREPIRVLSDNRDQSIRLFVTDVPHLYAVDFEFKLDALSFVESPARKITLDIHGSCTWSTTTATPHDVEIHAYSILDSAGQVSTTVIWPAGTSSSLFSPGFKRHYAGHR